MIQKSTSLKYEPSLELLLITAKQLFSNRELYRSAAGGAPATNSNQFGPVKWSPTPTKFSSGLVKLL